MKRVNLQFFCGTFRRCGLRRNLREAYAVLKQRKAAAAAALLLVMALSMNLAQVPPAATCYVDAETAVCGVQAGVWELPAMEVLSVTPASAVGGGLVEVRVEGKGIPVGVTFRMVGGGMEIGSSATVVENMRSAVCAFDLKNAAPATYDLMAVAPRGQVCVLPACFTVSPDPNGAAPPISQPPRNTSPAPQPGGPAAAPAPGASPAPGDPSGGTPTPETAPAPVAENPPGTSPDPALKVSPDFGFSGTFVDVVIQGAPFTKLMQVRLLGANAVSWAFDCRFPSDELIECRFNLNGLPPGEYALEVLGDCGVYRTGKFTVIEGGM